MHKIELPNSRGQRLPLLSEFSILFERPLFTLNVVTSHFHSAGEDSKGVVIEYSAVVGRSRVGGSVGSLTT